MIGVLYIICTQEIFLLFNYKHSHASYTPRIQCRTFHDFLGVIHNFREALQQMDCYSVNSILYLDSKRPLFFKLDTDSIYI